MSQDPQAILEQIRAHISTDLNKAFAGLDLENLDPVVEDYLTSHTRELWLVYKAMAFMLARASVQKEEKPGQALRVADYIDVQVGPYVISDVDVGFRVFQLNAFTTIESPQEIVQFCTSPLVRKYLFDGVAEYTSYGMTGDPYNSTLMVMQWGSPIQFDDLNSFLGRFGLEE